MSVSIKECLHFLRWTLEKKLGLINHKLQLFSRAVIVEVI